MTRPIERGDIVRVARSERLAQVTRTYEDGRTFGLRYIGATHDVVLPTACCAREDMTLAQAVSAQRLQDMATIERWGA
jgi:hypothetical protein